MLYNIAAIQYDIIYKSPERNRKKVKKLIEESSRYNPDLIVLPETWTTGFSEEVFQNVYEFAEKEDGKSIMLLRELAQKLNIWIASGTIIEADGSDIYNTMFLINRNGEIVGKYRKMHLYSAMKEDKAFKSGIKMPVFKTGLGKIALMTCYDIRFPEIARTYALRGAEAVIVVANFQRPKVSHWRTLLRARAIENQMYIIACNRVGATSKEVESCFGHSIIIDPWGEVIAEGCEAEETVTGEINLDRVKEVRKKIPVFSDRQPHNYPDDILKSLKC